MNRVVSARQQVRNQMAKLQSTYDALRGKNQRNDGKGLEEQVGRLLNKEGYRTVELNTRIKDPNGNWSEIDVIGKDRSFYHRFFKYSKYIPYGNKQIYVECKQYSPDTRVSLGDVSKFKEVLQLNRIPLKDGLFVSTTTYVPRATTIGINTIDGIGLKRWIKKFREVSPVRKKFTYSINVALASIILFIWGQMILDIREARTKTMNYLDDVQSIDSYKADIQKYGLDGFIVTNGKSPQERFSTFINTYDLFVYFAHIGLYKLLGKDTSHIKQTVRETKPTTTSNTKNQYQTFVAPKPNSLYMAYELHRPFPTNEPQRTDVFNYLDELGYKENQKHHILSKFPRWVLKHYNTYSMAYDYVLFNVNLPEYPAKFIPTALSSEYFQISQTTGQTYFKLPISHAYTVPGYFLTYVTLRLSQLQSLFKVNADTTGVINTSALFSAPKSFLNKHTSSTTSTPTDSAQTVDNDYYSESFISSTGSLLSRSPSSIMPPTFTSHTSESSFGDGFFNKTFSPTNNTNTTTSNNYTNEFTHAMSNDDMIRTADTFTNPQQQQLNRETVSFIDNDTSGDTFHPADDEFMSRGYMMAHGDVRPLRGGDNDDWAM